METDARKQRGLEIAARSKLQRTGEYWIVPSQSGNGKYVVHERADSSKHCSCPDHETRGLPCKHIYAVEYVVQREQNPDGSVTVTEAVRTTEVIRRTYRQDWPAYNAAQVNEKRKFQTLLRDLCQGIVEPERIGRGRPSIPLRDAIFAVCFKVYSTVSCRRFMTDLSEAHDKGLIGRLPCYNSIFNVLESEATTDILVRLVLETAKPLKAVESNFACDSTGFSASRFDRWFDHKHGKQKIQLAWVKAHVMCGVKTNVVTAVEIHGQNASDCKQLPALLDTTTANFDVKELSADLGYISEQNLQAVVDAGATPYIPFKRNTTDATGGLWAKMFHYFSLNRDEFLSRYHQRSNVESTFSMVKAKFGDSIRSKTDVAMKNEVLAKLVCHNICCLIQAIFELGVDPVFWGHQSPGAAEIAATGNTCSA